MKFHRLALVGAVAVMAIATSASAQSSDGNRAGVARTGLVSANPIGLLFEWYNGELERALAPTVSVAVAASRFDFFDNDTYTAVEGILRYYPAGRAIRGFAVGMSAGFINVEVDDCFQCDDDSESVGTVGVRGDYVWILGRDQRFAVAAGIGAKRLFGNNIGEAGLPIGRLSIGYAF
jgi:hypothetical protein